MRVAGKSERFFFSVQARQRFRYKIFKCNFYSLLCEESSKIISEKLSALALALQLWYGRQNLKRPG